MTAIQSRPLAYSKITTIVWGLCLCVATIAGCGAGTPHSEQTAALNPPSTHTEVAFQQSRVADGKLVMLQSPNKFTERKIIYDAKVAVEATDIDAFSHQLDAQLLTFSGFVADYSEQRHSGNRRTGTWKLRVDTSHFPELLQWLDAEFSVLNKTVNSQDVTEEFVDLSARLENKRNTEQRLSTLLEQRSGKLEEVLTVEKEIDRVREEIERIEGRVRYLADRTSLSTVSLSVATRVDFQPTVEAHFTSRITESWEQSVLRLRRTGEAFAVAAVGIAPWLPIWIGLMAGIYFSARFLLRRLIKLLDKPQPARPIAS